MSSGLSPPLGAAIGLKEAEAHMAHLLAKLAAASQHLGSFTSDCIPHSAENLYIRYCVRPSLMYFRLKTLNPMLLLRKITGHDFTHIKDHKI